MGCPPSCAASDRLLTSLYCHGYQLRLGRENFGTLESPGASSSLLAPVNLSFFVVLFCIRETVAAQSTEIACCDVISIAR